MTTKPQSTAEETPVNVHALTVLVCQDCIDLKGAMCNNAECVFCRRTMVEVQKLLDAMLLCPIVDGKRLILVGDAVTSEDTRVPASAAPVVDERIIAIVAAMAESSLWNANGYRQALADTLEKLRELRGPITSIEDGLRDLLNSYTHPCSDDCNHSQCPLLRALHALQIKTTMERARQTVKPIVDREREGERITSDIMNMRLHAPAAATAAPQDNLCLLCGHKGVAPDGTCMVPVPICSDDYHGTRRCGCKCRFPDTTAAPVEQNVLDSLFAVTLTCNQCGYIQAGSFKCPECDGYLIHLGGR